MIKRDKKKEKLKAEKREAWKKDLLVDVRTESRVEGTGKKVGHRQRVSLRVQRLWVFVVVEDVEDVWFERRVGTWDGSNSV